MSHRGGGNQRGRGGSRMAARGGGGHRDPNAGHDALHAKRCTRHADNATASRPPPQQFEQQFDNLSLKDKVAVDGSSLQMDPPIAIPRPNLMPSNKVDAKAFQELLKNLKNSGIQAEYPLRKVFATSGTSVYTNHFAIKLDSNTPLYEYNIIGLPAKSVQNTISSTHINTSR
jgi:hypothetical protein